MKTAWCGVLNGVAVLWCGAALAADAPRPVKAFILAGDENCLEQGAIAGRTDGNDVAFYPGEQPEKDETARDAICAVYKGGYAPGTDYDSLTPEVTGRVSLGEPQVGKRKPAPVTPFPELASRAGYTTVLRGYLRLPRSGLYEVIPGAGDSACNITTVAGREVYRREAGQAAATVTPVPLEGKRRLPFRTVFCGKPGTEFRVPLAVVPGALETVMRDKPRYAFLKDASGNWVQRSDVILYDAHPLHNNTRAPGRPLQVTNAVGPELMLGSALGDRVEAQVLLVRFATRHPTWFMRGSRSLGHDYLPPSSGGDPNLAGNWDVIHFNWGVWDATYHDKASKYYQGHGNTTAVADYGENLRKLVGRLKQTGATLIFANTTPVWEGDPGQPNGDVNAFNAVALEVMKDNGVIYEDLNAEVRRQGRGTSHNVHDVGNLSDVVTKGILEAVAARKQNAKPLPRVLLIGDSITGTYQEQVTRNLDGKAAVFKNPGNAESTWTGVKRIDDWLDLKQYLQNGQEYLELVNAVNDSLAQIARFCPGYQGQGFEMAGLVWFQGIADTQSPALSASYERNLANLIRDLRRDLRAPTMPVVVAAIACGDGRVHDAQMAVGNPAKYPEFAGNVASVDTRPFCRSAELSPGGHAACYCGSAEAFLEIGDALGSAMLGLLKPGK